MLKNSKIEKIKELLYTNGEVSVQELTQLLGVSAVTVRSYLKTLEQEGVLRRTRGGGILSQTLASRRSKAEKFIIPYATTDDEHRRSIIGELGAKYVQPATWILLGAGKGCAEMAKRLVGFQVNICTSNLEAALILSSSGMTNVMILGGQVGYRGDHTYLYGNLFDRAMEDISVDQAFISVAAINEGGLMVSDPTEIYVCKHVAEIAREIVVLCDSSKFDQTSFLRVADLSYMHTIISDQIPEKYQAIFRANGMRMITPE